MLKKELISYLTVLNKDRWKYAKSFASFLPHFYLRRYEAENPDLFSSVIQSIREYGVIKHFYKRQYLYFEHDGYEYWEMGRPSDAVIIINRAKIDDFKPYRLNELDACIYSKEELKDFYLEYHLGRENRVKFLREKYASKNDLSKEEKDELNFLLNNNKKSPNRVCNYRDFISKENKVIPYEYIG